MRPYLTLILTIALLLGLAAPSGGCSPRSTADQATGFQPVAIWVSPERPVLSIGQTLSLRATGVNAHRETADLSALVEWETSDAGVASVSNALDQEGQLSAIAVGAASAWATLGDVASPAVPLQVTAAEVIALKVSPDSVTASQADTVALHAETIFSYGLRSNGTDRVRWVTDDGAVATLEPDGRLHAVSVGQTRIQAIFENVESEKVPVTVIPATENARPDLRVDHVVASIDGDLLNLSFDVVNDGEVGASNFWVDVFLDPITPPSVGDFGSEFFSPGYVGPGASVGVFVQVVVDPGLQSVAMVVDSGAAIDESNESNNISAQNTFGSGYGLPNLAIDGFDYLNDASYVYYQIKVRNNGTAASSGFLIELFADRSREPVPGFTGDDLVWIESLAPGASATLDTLIEQTCDPCRSWAIADLDNVVDEDTEADNAAGPLVIYTE